MLLLDAQVLRHPNGHHIASLRRCDFRTRLLDHETRGGREILGQADLRTRDVAVSAEHLDDVPVGLEFIDALDASGSGLSRGGSRGRAGAVHEAELRSELTPILGVRIDSYLTVGDDVRIKNAAVVWIGLVLDGVGVGRDPGRNVRGHNIGPVDRAVLGDYLQARDANATRLGVGLLFGLPGVPDGLALDACSGKPGTPTAGAEGGVERLKAREVRVMRVAVGATTSWRNRGCGCRGRASGRGSGGLHRRLCRRGAVIVERVACEPHGSDCDP